MEISMSLMPSRAARAVTQATLSQKKNKTKQNKGQVQVFPVAPPIPELCGEQVACLAGLENLNLAGQSVTFWASLDREKSCRALLS